MKGCVFNIQHYSVHDGPGIRTIVFLKGCPLRCRWCCNPESQMPVPQIAYNIEKCMGDTCRLCESVCPKQNIAFMDTNKVWINHDNCVNCLQCANACPAEAISCYGKIMEAKEVIDVVEQDASFYSRSGGGLTLSGGEPLANPEFALKLLTEAKRRRISTAIETCGCARWEDARTVFEKLDYVLFDIKCMDSQKHREWTGHGNEMILDTFANMRKEFPQLKTLVRTPVIPGFNDTEEDIAAIRDFAGQFENTEYECLKYHRYGTTKYGFLGRKYKMGDVELDNGLFLHLKAVSQRGRGAGRKD